jgi:hypothetical protein
VKAPEACHPHVLSAGSQGKRCKLFRRARLAIRLASYSPSTSTAAMWARPVALALHKNHTPAISPLGGNAGAWDGRFRDSPGKAQVVKTVP